MNMTFQLSGSHSQPWELNLSHPQLHQTNLQYLAWPPDPQQIPHLDKTKQMLRMHVHYVCSLLIRAHSRTRAGPPVFTLRGQWLFFSAGSKVSNKKIQYSKCTGSAAYQYIIQKGDKWQAIRRWKAIESSVSPYPAASGRINLQLLIIELRRGHD